MEEVQVILWIVDQLYNMMQGYVTLLANQATTVLDQYVGVRVHQELLSVEEHFA